MVRQYTNCLYCRLVSVHDLELMESFDRIIWRGLAALLMPALAHSCSRDGVGEPSSSRALMRVSPVAQASYEGPRQRANVAMMGALDVLGRMFKPQ